MPAVETFTELYPGQGGSKMDERLVSNAAAGGGGAHRSVIVPGSADGAVQSFVSEDGLVKAATTGLSNAELRAAPIPVVSSDQYLQQRYDIQASVIYVGYAAEGTPGDAPLWKIKKIDFDGSGNPTISRWSSLIATWDNRASEAYS